MLGRPKLSWLGCQGVAEHVIGLGGVVAHGKQLRVRPVPAEPMPKLNQRADAGTGQGPTATLPSLDGVAVHTDQLGEGLLAKAGGLADQLQQVAADDPLSGSGDRATAPGTSEG